MKIFKLLKNPLIRTSAVIAIIYFALFSNKQNPNGLGNRLSKENLEKDFFEVSNKTKFIFYNVGEAKKYATTQKQLRNKTKEEIQKLKIEDLKIGTQNKAACGDRVSINYTVLDESNEIYSTSEELVIGMQHDLLLEEKIVGMMEGGVRLVHVPSGFKSENKLLANILIKHTGGVKYQIILLKVTKPTNSTIFCDQNDQT